MLLLVHALFLCFYHLNPDAMTKRIADCVSWSGLKRGDCFLREKAFCSPLHANVNARECIPQAYRSSHRLSPFSLFQCLSFKIPILSVLSVSRTHILESEEIRVEEEENLLNITTTKKKDMLYVVSLTTSGKVEESGEAFSLQESGGDWSQLSNVEKDDQIPANHIKKRRLSSLLQSAVWMSMRDRVLLSRSIPHHPLRSYPQLLPFLRRKVPFVWVRNTHSQKRLTSCT